MDPVQITAASRLPFSQHHGHQRKLNANAEDAFYQEHGFEIFVQFANMARKIKAILSQNKGAEMTPLCVSHQPEI